MLQFFDGRQKAFKLTAFLLATGVCLALVIWGVTRHEETGLMGACFGPTGRLTTPYEEWGPDECPPLTWPLNQLPINVTAYANDEGSSTLKTRNVRGAVDGLNRVLGFELYRFTEDENADVIVIVDSPTVNAKHNRGADTEHIILSDRMTAIVRIANVVIVASAMNAIEHELLHVAGLGHDDFDFSIMSPDNSEKSSHVTDSDRNLLREIYKGKSQ